jgi:sporulation protein YlmC with PRC-barrel domain
MTNRSYFAILAGSALFTAGLAGCDAGDQRDPGTPEPESSVMYDDDRDTTRTDPMAERQMEAEDRVQQAQRDAQRQQDRSFADPQMESESALDSLETLGAEEIVGKTVVNQQGEEIGEVDDVVIDQASQQHLAVVDVGGFLGLGEKSVAVSFDQLHLADDGRIRSDLTRETLESQPEYDPAHYGEAADPME